MSISDVAQRFGLRPSALRYYEQIGILPAPIRVGGKRRYDLDMLRRLAVIQRARQLGFSLDEIDTLFSSFTKGATASELWRGMAKKKLAELQRAADGIEAIRNLLGVMARCDCNALDECGDGLLNGCGQPSARGAGEARLLVSTAGVDVESMRSRRRSNAV
jgi:MerR family redox-sensitive transcriptional activator SoxR